MSINLDINKASSKEINWGKKHWIKWGEEVNDTRRNNQGIKNQSYYWKGIG